MHPQFRADQIPGFLASITLPDEEPVLRGHPRPRPGPDQLPRKELVHRLRKRWCELCEHGATVAVHQVAALSTSA